MSMYSHPSNHYSQVPSHSSYPAYSSYPPPYQYAQPSSSYLLDPTSFRRDYMERLADLTVNSRPIIQNLSMIAQEYSRYADVVTECIEQHIRRVPPSLKLPSWYLLDAISKNVHEPYARHFAAIVASLFLDSYAEVDPNTRSKMEEMLLTWRTGAPSGRELFGVGPQLSIERGIWGSGSGTNPSFQAGSGFISKSQVLSELEFTLGQMERALQMDPYDQQAQTHVHVLQQLRKLVEAGVSQKELQQILNQLRTMARPPSASPPAPAPPMRYPPASNQQYYSNPAPYSAPEPAPQPISPPPPIFEQSFPPPEMFDSHPNEPTPSFPPMESSPPVHVAAPASTSSAPIIPNITGLFEALRKAGVVSATGTPVGAGEAQPAAFANAPEPMADVKPEKQQESSDREDMRVYRDAILAENIKLTNADITRRRPRIVEFLYDRLPVQCKQCGVRYTDSPSGKKQMQEHLDVHFRQNRKAKEHAGRGYSRSWFVALEDWVDANGKGKGPADPLKPSNTRAALAADAAKRDAELRSQFVVVPPGDEAKTVACPICKESLKSEFQEDDEEWVWKNAVDVDGRVYHATCHSEALNSTTGLAAKLRQELGVDSRSTTPERTMSNKMHMKSESPKQSIVGQVIGVKRKVEAAGEMSNGGLNGHGFGENGSGGSSGYADEGSSEPPVKKATVTASA